MPPLLLLFLQASAYQAGIQAYTQHHFDEAIAWFEKAAAGGEHALTARYMLGNACLTKHQDAKALDAFAALYEVAPDSAAAHLITAAMMLRAGMTAEAAQQAGRAIEIDPRIPQAHYILGLATQGAGEFEKEIDLNPAFAMSYYRLGNAYENRGAWDDAVSILERAIWLNPNHSGPYELIGKAYLHRGEVKDAAAALHHALDMDPHDEEARRLLAQTTPPVPPPQRQTFDPAYLRGVTSYRKQDYVAAAQSLREALPAMGEKTPQYRETLQMIGRSEYLAGHVPAAIPWLEKARAAGTPNNELLFVLGNSYLQMHQVAKGRAAFAELYRVPADSGCARAVTARLLMRLEFEDDAQVELRAALAREPKLPEAHFMLGEIAIYRAQMDRAAEELRREIAVNPAFAMSYYRLGDAYTRREDWDRAVPPLQRAVWLDPTYSGPYILLGKTYLKKGDLAEAEHMLRRALEIDPKNASAHYLLGRTLIQAGHAEEGKRLLREWEVLKQEPGQ